MNRISSGFQMLKMSWRIVRSSPELIFLPITAILAFVLAAASLYEGVNALVGLTGSGLVIVLSWLAALLALFAAGAFIAVIFSAAIILAARARVDGRNLGLSGSLSQAWKHRGNLFKWGILSSTVGIFLNAESRSHSGFASSFADGLDLAWTAATFLVIPVIVLENLNVGASLRRASTLFYKQWGEEVTGYVGLNLIFGLTFGLIFVASIILCFVALPLGLAFGGAAGLLLLIVGTAIRGTFNAVLYGSAAGQVAQPEVALA